ncbi:MAG: hypothetical protein U1B83_07690 [Candidatus Cloacimonadaceae bacterium]|nr:hypothetical protein [Candidatus Cloacimonadaceae bacterium]
MRFHKYILCFLLLIPLHLLSQSLLVDEILELKPDTNEYQFAKVPIIKGSETIYADSLLLVSGRDYALDHKSGKLVLIASLSHQYIRVQYILIPTALRDAKWLYQPRAKSDSLFRSITRTKTPWWTDDGKLNLSGSKTFAITFSEDSTFDLKQSLFVNLSGELSQNVAISAQLSDSQTKLSPEGDSKELSSLDQVFVRVFGKQYEISMGDIEWEFKDTRYINYKSKFEGLNAWWGDEHFIQAGFSAGSGKRARINLTIIDGKQGPYYLNPTGFQSSHIIIAGSEQIYQDGRLLERGLDYSIDYSEGAVTFRVLVASTNLISAFFQYSDEFFRQSTYFNSSRVSILPGLSLTHHIIHQTDSKDKPLLYDMSPADRDSLRLAGDAQAWGEGIFAVEPGTGTYILITSPGGVDYYEYAQSDTLADYNIFFSYVGFGFGDYEQYSSGKYRYVGANQGSWLPRKRLVSPVTRTNMDTQLLISHKRLLGGVEALYSLNDKNTLSSLDDDDNAGGILHLFAQYRSRDDLSGTRIGIDHEKRWANSYLFAKFSDPQTEYDFSALDQADSLAQHSTNLSAATQLGSFWKPELFFRYKEIKDYYDQMALRFISRSQAVSILPELNLRNTISRQDYQDGTERSSLLQYHEAGAIWDWSYFKARFNANYQSLNLQDPNQALDIRGNRYYKLSPQLGFGIARAFYTDLSYAYESTDLDTGAWQTLSESDTYAVKHLTATLNHSLNLDLTRREIRRYDETPGTKFDLISARSSHQFLKNALNLMSNYQLNQTEFYPKIRELEYVGAGLGLYDSTGVYLPDGDYDYVFITAETGTLSTEINALLSIYLTPGNITQKGIWKRVRSDVSIQATEQTAQSNDPLQYIFYPGTVYDEESTIYGKQNYQQNLWLDLIRNRLLGVMSLEIDRSLDNRYQSRSRTFRLNRGGRLELKQFYANNLSLEYLDRRETDTRYLSRVTLRSLDLTVLRPLSVHSQVQVIIGTAWEDGGKDDSSENYSLKSYRLNPSWRSTWSRRGRLAAQLRLQYNDREGSDFLSFLPEKRSGLQSTWSISANYRLNEFSSFTLEYSGNVYPEEKINNQLKLEFRAEL